MYSDILIKQITCLERKIIIWENWIKDVSGKIYHRIITKAKSFKVSAESRKWSFLWTEVTQETLCNPVQRGIFRKLSGTENGQLDGAFSQTTPRPEWGRARSRGIWSQWLVRLCMDGRSLRWKEMGSHRHGDPDRPSPNLALSHCGVVNALPAKGTVRDGNWPWQCRVRRLCDWERLSG